MSDTVVGFSGAAFLIFLILLMTGYLLKKPKKVLVFFFMAFIPAVMVTATLAFGSDNYVPHEFWVITVTISAIAILVGGIIGAEIRISADNPE